jgi:hypothetical protein
MKFSVSRGMLVLVVIGVAMLAFTVLMLVFYFGAVSETSRLEDEIRDLEVELARIDEPDIPGLRQQIEDLQEQIDNDAFFPKPPFDTGSKYDVKQVTNALFEVTDDAYVDLDSLNHNQGSDVTIGTGLYRVDAYALKCSVMDVEHADRLVGLLELLEELREDEYSTLMVDNIRFPSGGVSIDFDLGIVTQTFAE